MVIYIQDVLARRHAATQMATNRMVAAGGNRARSHPAPSHIRRSALMATMLPNSGGAHLYPAIDLPTLYAEASLV